MVRRILSDSQWARAVGLALFEVRSPAPRQGFVKAERQATASSYLWSGSASPVEPLLIEPNNGVSPCPVCLRAAVMVRRRRASRVPLSRRWTFRQVGVLKGL